MLSKIDLLPHTALVARMLKVAPFGDVLLTNGNMPTHGDHLVRTFLFDLGMGVL